MSNPSMIHDARQLATRAHRGQTDKAGADYIDHPRRVASGALAHADPAWQAETVAAAWLHDVLEDTPVTRDELARRFPAEVVEAVEALTRHDGEPVDDYYARVRANPIARAVKHADLDDNTDPQRMRLLDLPTQQRLRQKYARARQALAIT